MSAWITTPPPKQLNCCGRKGFPPRQPAPPVWRGCWRFRANRVLLRNSALMRPAASLLCSRSRRWTDCAAKEKPTHPFGMGGFLEDLLPLLHFQADTGLEEAAHDAGLGAGGVVVDAAILCRFDRRQGVEQVLDVAIDLHLVGPLVGQVEIDIVEVAI